MTAVVRALVVVALLALVGWWASASWRGEATPSAASTGVLPQAAVVEANRLESAPDDNEVAAPDDGLAVDHVGGDAGDDVDEDDQRELIEDAARRQRKVMFELVDIAPEQCRGEYTWSLYGSETKHFPLTGPRFEVPFEYELLQVEVIVPGYAIAQRHAPFFPLDEPKQLHMVRAGELVIDLVDERGTPLGGRHVHCQMVSDGRDAAKATTWGDSDRSGRAHMHNVLPGDYYVYAGGVAEWQDAELRSVTVAADGVATCRLVVPMLDPQRYGGFVLHPGPGDVLADGAGAYWYRLDDGREFRLWPVDGTLRCVVPGEPGQTFVGRIDWRDRDGAPHVPSMRSEPLTVVVGSMASAVPVWSEVK